MKILDFVPYYRPHIGGLERFAQELHRQLITQGDEVIVYTPNLPPSQEREFSENLTIIRYPAFELIQNYPFPKLWDQQLWKQVRELSQIQFDRVISTSRFFFLSYLAHLFARWHKIPRLHLEHGSDHVTSTPLITAAAYIYDYTFGRATLRGAQQVVTASQSAARFVKKLSGIDAPVIYGGVSFDDLATITPNPHIRSQYPNKKILLYLGRLIHGKAVHVLLNSIASLTRDDFILLVVGDGPEMSNLRTQAQKLSLESKVVFMGSKPMSEAIAILKISDIFVNPSLNEGLPVSLCEAAACRISIVATTVGGTPEIVTNEESALLIPPNESRLLAQALDRALDYPDLRQKLTEQAFLRIDTTFRWEKNGRVYRHYLYELKH